MGGFREPSLKVIINSGPADAVGKKENLLDKLHKLFQPSSTGETGGQLPCDPTYASLIPGQQYSTPLVYILVDAAEWAIRAARGALAAI